MIGAYIVYNPDTDETYAGSGILRKRERVHMRTLESSTHHNHKLQEAYHRNPNFEFIAVPTETREEARALEQAIINEFWGNPLFLNLSNDATKCCAEQTPEVKRKISETLKQQIQDGSRLPPMIGKKHSEETKAKYSRDRIGNQHALGSRHTEEWKEDRSKAMQGNQHLLGHQHSEETKARMSEAHTGRKRSEEEILKSAEGRTKKNVVVDGVAYLNSAAAAKALGISRSGVDKRCLSLNFPEYKFVEAKK
jgi:group I intron endonuclease